jgi:hypothetical protein
MAAISSNHLLMSSKGASPSQRFPVYEYRTVLVVALLLMIAGSLFGCRPDNEGLLADGTNMDFIPELGYDCDGEAPEANECGEFDWEQWSCKNSGQCEYKYKFGDWLPGHSCRCNHRIQDQDVHVGYDCDGHLGEDGRLQDECGKWDYRKGKCANLDKCEYRFEFGDLNLDQSCRCRRNCFLYYKGTAAADTNLTVVKPNIGHWSNWCGNVDTCAPWQTPIDDQELAMILHYARSKGYKVRPSGASHSAGPLVTDAADKDVVVVSLANYRATAEWEEGKIFDAEDGTKRIKANAGWTLLDLYEKIRPEGYFLPTHTAGQFFQLAGVVSGSVHGGTYQGSFLHSYVTSLRVMSYNGTISVVDNETDLKYWRNSYGLLGIILGVEFRVEHHAKYQLFSKTTKLEGWNAESFWSVIKGDGEANLPVDLVPDGGDGSRKAMAGEFFFQLACR